MTSYAYLDSNLVTLYGSIMAPNSSDDLDLTFFRRYYYILNNDGATVTVYSARVSTVKTLTLSLSANTSVTALTNNRKYLVGIIKDTLGATADKLAWWDFSGNKVNEIVNSAGNIGKYKNLCYLRNYYYTIDTTTPAVHVYDSYANQIRSFNLTASKTYSGITHDRHNLWLIRTDYTTHTSGTIEHWSTNGTFIKNFAAPNIVIAGASQAVLTKPGITFNRRYKIIGYTPDIPPVNLS